MDLMLDIQYTVRAEQDMPPEVDFQDWVAAALEGRREAAEVTVRIVDEPEGRDLNQRYRQRDYATNVLSFPADLPAEVEVPLLGDIVICAPVVIREADAQGKEWRSHWAHLTVHGVLHLLGYDHQEDAEAERMEALETEIMGRLGFPDPYQPIDSRED